MLKQKSFLSFIANILSSMMGFASVYFISHYMGPEAMGAISSSLAFVGLFAIFGDFGFGLAHYKRISEGMDLGRCIGTFIYIRIGTTLLMALATLGVFYGSYLLVGKFPVESEYLNIFFIVFVSSILGNLVYIITYTFAARIERAKEWSTLLSQKFVNSLFRIITAISGAGVIWLAWSNLAGVIAGVIISLYLFRKYPVGRFDKTIFKSYLVFAIPSIMIGVTETISMNLDKVFISFFAGVKEVGYYASAQSLISILSYIGMIFVGILLPTYSGFHAKGMMQEIRNLANKVEKYISIVVMPLVFFIFFFSDPLRVVLLGNNFGPSGVIMSVLALNAMLVIFTQPYSSQLMGTNQIRLGMLLAMLMLVTNIILNLVLIPSEMFGIRLFGLGGLGAAISLLISSLAGTMMFRYFAFKTSKSKPNYKILIHLVISVFVFGGMSLLFRTYSPPKIYLLLYFIAGEALFLGLMILVRQFKKEDFLYYYNMINPLVMKNYILKELKSKPDKDTI